MDPVFHRALAQARDAQPVVLGLRLRPLTLGHLFLLTEIRSPYLGFDFGPSPFADFFLTVFICAQDDAEKARAAFDSWWLPIFFRLWSFKARPRRGRDVLKESSKGFRDWLAGQMASPSYGVSTRDALPGKCGAPSPFVKLMFAMHALNMTRAQAMAMPLIEHSALHATWLDWQGRISLTETDAHEELMRLVAIEDAKRFNPDGTRKAPPQTSHPE